MNTKLLEPRKVESGAFSRWLRLAFKLVRRRLITWLVLSTFCAVTAMALGFSVVIQITITMAILLVGAVFASIVDRGNRDWSFNKQYQLIVDNLPPALAVVGYSVLVFFVVSLAFSVFDGESKARSWNVSTNRGGFQRFLLNPGFGRDL